MYPMAPWAGRIRHNRIDWNGESRTLLPSYQAWALHGFTLDQAVECTRISTGDDSALIEFTADINEWFAPLRILMQWRLHMNRVESTITVHTESTEPVPVIVGWHPWFVNSLGPSADLTVQTESAHLAIRQDAFPSGEFCEVRDFDAEYDDCFRIPSREVILHWGKELHLRIQNSHEWFVIYNGASNFMCIEPQSGPPNGLNNSLGADTLTTSAREPLSMTTVWSLGIHQ
jgi:aldose 1-epimerase